jgi:hypothetical protein
MGCFREDLSGQMQDQSDPFVNLNMDFRKTYKKLQADVIDAQQPTILLIGDNMLLIQHERRDTQRMLEPMYHDLKTIAHIPFAIYLMLVNDTDVQMSKEKILQLNHFRKLMEEGYDVLSERGFTKEQSQNQEQLFGMSFKFIDDMLSLGIVRSEELRAFILGSRPYFEKNIDGAVKSQLDRMHEIMTEWYNAFSEQEKSDLKVLISGPQVARKNTLAVLYFAKFLREMGEGARIFYAEGVYTEEEMLKVMANRILSVQAGNDVFENPNRLVEDLLGQSAERYLQKMKF